MMKHPTTWILLRGLIRGQFHWHEFPQKLSTARPDDQVICIDIPGNGERYSENTPWSIGAIANDIEEKIKNLNFEHPVHLISISMGAMIATEIAASMQNKIASLHLINTSFSNFNPPWQRMKLDAVAGLIPNLFSIEKRERAILKWTSNQQNIEQYVPAWATEARRHPLSFKNTLAQLLGAARFKAPKSAPIPHSFVYGAIQDRLVSHKCSLAVANNWKVPMAIHPTAGHDLPLDEPEWLIDMLLGNASTIEGIEAKKDKSVESRVSR